MRLAVGEGSHRLRIGGEVFEARLDRNGVIVVVLLIDTREPAWWLRVPRPVGGARVSALGLQSLAHAG
jgi:hypothetical protein